MTSGLSMPAPVCLFENSNGQFTVNQEALKVLATFTQPMVVVAIVGPYRTGKSYLMNKLARQRTGFSLGSTVQAHTKGIWMWCVPHPKKPNHTLVLLDTEGLGDVKKGDNKNDTWIFALAMLLSSTFVYNSMGTINQQAIDQLHYVTELTDKIKAKSSCSTEQMSLFPDFVWTVRDFILDLEIHGEPITSDQYLEDALELKKGPMDKGTSEEAKICIQKFFLKRKCFLFAPPAYCRLKDLEKLQDNELDAGFVESTKHFCEYIFNHSEAKTLPGGSVVNGPRFGNLSLTYVETITNGDVPCMENAVLALAQIENSAAVQRALTLYEEMMEQKVKFPTETLQELLDVHITCRREVIEVFTKSSFKDVKQKFQTTLEDQLQAKLHDFCRQNERESLDRCTVLLQDIFRPLEEAAQKGEFAKSGGYDIFLQKRQELIENYNQKPGKGIQAEKSLEEYLKSTEIVADTIKQADQAITEKERKKKEEQMKVQAAENVVFEWEALLSEMEQTRLERQKAQQEQIRKKNEDLENQKRWFLAGAERERNRILQEEERLQRKKLEKEREEHQRKIQALKRQIANNNQQFYCIIS